MIDLLVRLVEAESPSLVPEAQGPVQEILIHELESRGLRVRRIPGEATGDHLLAVPAGREHHGAVQLLLGHCDTVWPLGTLASMPITRSDERLEGPGVYDMKAGLVHILFAIDAVRALGAPLTVTPIIFINSDEEIGSHSSSPTIIRLARIANRVFVMEPSLGRRGLLKTARKGVGRFTVTVNGRAAHAGLDPERGASAILELSHAIQKLFQLNDPERGVTVNVGTIEGGLRPNVIAPRSSATADVRVLHGEDVEAVEQAIRGLRPTTPGTEILVTGHFGRPPMERTPGNQRLWQCALHAASELGLSLEEGTAGGGSDGNFTSLYAPTLDGLGAVGDGAHAPDEFIELRPMPERIALLARLLLDPPLAES